MVPSTYSNVLLAAKWVPRIVLQYRFWTWNAAITINWQSIPLIDCPPDFIILIKLYLRSLVRPKQIFINSSRRLFISASFLLGWHVCKWIKWATLDLLDPDILQIYMLFMRSFEPFDNTCITLRSYFTSWANVWTVAGENRLLMNSRTHNILSSESSVKNSTDF